MIPDWAAFLLVIGLFGALMLILRTARARGMDAELSRKGIHTGMGVVTLAFPWLFHHPLPVVLLGAASVATLAGVRLIPSLRSRFGGVVGDVERFSLGELYFPIAVSILFCIAYKHPLLFCIPILILTVADAVAALVGGEYGKHKYTTLDGTKSAEGSIAFFTATFMAVHIPLLLVANLGRAETLLVSVAIALMMTLIEAVAWRGLDNLFIPLGGYLLLRHYIQLDTRHLLEQVVVLAVICVLVLGYRKRTSLRDGAVLAGALVLYLSYAVGGIRALAAPLVVYVAYPLLKPGGASADTSRHNSVTSVVAVTAVGLGWLFLSSILQTLDVSFPYYISYAVQLALIAVVRTKYCSENPPTAAAIALIAFAAWTVETAVYLVLSGHRAHYGIRATFGLPIVVSASVLFAVYEPGLTTTPTTGARLTRQALWAGAASVASLAVIGVR